MMGAAWATIGTYLILAIIAWVISQRAMPISYEFKKMILILLPAIAAYLLNVELENYAAERWHLASLLAAKAIIVLAYIGTMFLLRVVEREDMDRIRDLGRELLARVSPRRGKNFTPPAPPSV